MQFTMEQLKNLEILQIKALLNECFKNYNSPKEYKPRQILTILQALMTHCEELYRETKDEYFLAARNRLYCGYGLKGEHPLYGDGSGLNYSMIADLCYFTIMEIKRRITNG